MVSWWLSSRMWRHAIWQMSINITEEPSSGNLPWRWWSQIPLKRWYWYPFIRLHGAPSQSHNSFKVHTRQGRFLPQFSRFNICRVFSCSSHLIVKLQLLCSKLRASSYVNLAENPYWEADSWLDDRDIFRLMCNSTLDHVNLVHTRTYCSFMTNFNIIVPSIPRSPKWRFPKSLQTKMLH
jgi:hypothetical protein